MEKATITKNVFTCGEATFEINRDHKDNKGLIETINAIDKQPSSVWLKFATALELPVEPFDKSLLRPVLKGELQSAWYASVGKNGVPGVSEGVKNAQMNRINEYKQKIAALVTRVVDDADFVTKLKMKKTKTAKVTNLFVLVASKINELCTELYGQQYIVVKSMKELQAAGGAEYKGSSLSQIFTNAKNLEGVPPITNSRTSSKLKNLVIDGYANELDPTTFAKVTAVKKAAKKKAAKAA